MRLASIIIVLSACTFEGAPSAAGSVVCGVTDPAANGLAACFEFEGSLADSVGNVPPAAIVGSSLDMFVDDRERNGQAVRFGGLGYLRAGASNEYMAQEQSITLDLWALSSVRTTIARFALVDHVDSVALFIAPSGGIQCNGRWGDVTTVETIALDTWTHIACRQTPTGGAEVFIDGAQVACADNQDLPGTGNQPIFIGADAPIGDQILNGAIDTLRYSTRALSDAELCTAADKANCPPPSISCDS